MSHLAKHDKNHSKPRILKGNQLFDALPLLDFVRDALPEVIGEHTDLFLLRGASSRTDEGKPANNMGPSRPESAYIYFENPKEVEAALQEEAVTSLGSFSLKPPKDNSSSQAIEVNALNLDYPAFSPPELDRIDHAQKIYSIFEQLEPHLNTIKKSVEMVKAGSEDRPYNRLLDKDGVINGDPYHIKGRANKIINELRNLQKAINPMLAEHLFIPLEDVEGFSNGDSIYRDGFIKEFKEGLCYYSKENGHGRFIPENQKGEFYEALEAMEKIFEKNQQILNDATHLVLYSKAERALSKNAGPSITCKAHDLI